MSRVASRALVWAFSAVLGLGACLGAAPEASATLSYRGLFEARENEAGRILQSQDQLLGFEISQSMSDRVTAREKLGYNHRWEETTVTRETLSPGVAMTMAGDIFVATLAVDSVKNLNADSDRTETDALGITWSSNWQKELVPQLRATYDFDRRQSDYATRIIDEERQGAGAEVNWDLKAARLFCSYREDETTELGSRSNQDNLLARVEAGRVWLDDRLRVSLGHEYSETNLERTLPFGPSGIAILPLTLTDVRIGSDPTPADDIDTMFSAAPAMIDSDRNTTAHTPALADANISILLVTNDQEVDRVYLYANNLLSAPLNLNWRVYSNDNLTTTWNQESIVSVTYEPANRRFVLVLPSLRALALKIVVDQGGLAPAILFTEIAAQQELAGSANSNITLFQEMQANKSHLNLDFRITPLLSLYYNLLLDQQEYNGLNLHDRENHDGGIRLQNSAGGLKANLGYRLSAERYFGSPETRTEGYRLNVNKVFLPTLTVSLGGFRDESTIDGAAVSARNQYLFYADAKLYPDLTSKLEINYTESETYLSEKTTATDSLRSEFTLSSRFRPDLTVGFSEIYEAQYLNEQRVSNKNTLSLSFNWALSEMFTVNGTAAREDNKPEPDGYLFAGSMGMRLSSTLEIRGDYFMRMTDEFTSQSANAYVRWTHIRNISWEVGCNYAESETVAEQNAAKVYSKFNMFFTTQ